MIAFILASFLLLRLKLSIVITPRPAILANSSCAIDALLPKLPLAAGYL